MRKNKESRATREVWRWKEEAYREVSHLSVSDALKKRIKDCVESEKTLRNKHVK